MPRTNSGCRILTAGRSTPVIPDNLLLAAAATFARQPPRAGPPADVLAAALATPLPRTRPSSPPAGEPARVGDYFKLPTFWPKEPVIYFQQIEVLLDQHHITGSVAVPLPGAGLVAGGGHSSSPLPADYHRCYS